MLGVITPVILRWLSRAWHLGIPVHRTVMVLYFVDIVRRHSHPLFVLWILDKVWGMYWGRCRKLDIRRLCLDDDYMVLFWKHSPSPRRSSTVGPDYYSRLNEFSLLENAHVFTTFGNHHNVILNDDEGPFEWSVGTVVRVFDNPHVSPLGRHNLVSNTKRMFDASPLDVTAWGPYPGEMSEHVRLAWIGPRPVVLVAAGSGIGYALDTLQWVSRRSDCSQCHLKVLFPFAARVFLFMKWNS